MNSEAAGEFEAYLQSIPEDQMSPMTDWALEVSDKCGCLDV